MEHLCPPSPDTKPLEKVLVKLKEIALFHGAFGFSGLVGSHSCFSGKDITLRNSRTSCFRNSKYISRTVRTPNFRGRMRVRHLIGYSKLHPLAIIDYWSSLKISISIHHHVRHWWARPDGTCRAILWPQNLASTVRADSSVVILFPKTPRKQCRPMATPAKTEMHLGHGEWREGARYSLHSFTIQAHKSPERKTLVLPLDRWAN